jgi:ectoine hydroxylase-related dioxygenase (phytanoyl-CoA dioxygenase family)
MMEQLIADGYFVHERLITEPHLSQLRDALDEVAEREAFENPALAADTQKKRFGGQFIRHLFDRHPLFLEFVHFAPTLSVARAALGPQVRTRMSARISVPSDEYQQVEWHVHTLPPPDPMPPFYAFPHSLDVLIYLDEVNEANGLLYVLPGSHKRFDIDIPEGNFDDQPGQVAVAVPAGSAVFFHNHLWHRATPTTPQGTVRRMLGLTYYPAWSRGSTIDGPQPENGETQKLVATGDPETLELLGLR